MTRGASARQHPPAGQDQDGAPMSDMHPGPVPEEAVCKCGHGKSSHEDYFSPDACEECATCRAFAPATVPAPHADAEEASPATEYVEQVAADNDRLAAELAAANARITQTDREDGP